MGADCLYEIDESYCSIYNYLTVSIVHNLDRLIEKSIGFKYLFPIVDDYVYVWIVSQGQCVRLVNEKLLDSKEWKAKFRRELIDRSQQDQQLKHLTIEIN